MFIGYRWYDALDLDVRYPFGHGLPYTEFEYRDLRVDELDAEAGTVKLYFTVANVGARDGAEVVQVYTGDHHSAVRRPVRELRAFETVYLAAGLSQRVILELTGRDVAYHDVVGRVCRREAGEVTIDIGASSRDIRLTTVVRLADDPTIPPLVPDAALAAATAGTGRHDTEDYVPRSSVVERE